MAATSPGAGGGNFLTRKLGPLPIWVWVGVGVAVLYLYQSRKSAQAGSSSAGTDPTTAALAQQGAAAMQYGYSSPDIASMLSNLEGQVALLGGGNHGTTGTGATSPGSTGNPATTPPPGVPRGEKLVGSGYYVPGSEVPITGPGGHTYQWIAGPGPKGALPKGTPIWIQPLPGYFVEAKPGMHIISGTPQFVQVT
jgi:hypothetical protein